MSLVWQSSEIGFQARLEVHAPAHFVAATLDLASLKAQGEPPPSLDAPTLFSVLLPIPLRV